MRFELTESNRHGMRGAAVLTGVLVIGAAVAFGCADADRASGGDAPEASSVPATPPVAVPAATVETTPVTTPEPVVPTTVTYGDGESAYRAGDYARAVTLFEAYTERKRGNAFGYYMLGLSARQTGALDKAEHAFRRSLELDATHAKSYFNLGRVYIDLHQPDSARSAIEQGLALTNGGGDGLRLLARGFDESGDTESAVATYHQALVQDPADAWSMNNLGLILIRASRHEDALAPLARAVELRDDLAVVHNNLGMALELTGNFEAAKQAYRDALAVQPGYEKSATNLARIQGFGNRPDLVAVDLDALARSFEDDIARWAGRGGEDTIPVEVDGPAVPDTVGGPFE